MTNVSIPCLTSHYLGH